MKTLKLLQCSFFCAIILLVSSLSMDCFAQHKRMTTKDLTVESTSVVYGKCSRIRSEWNPDHSIIYTRVTIKPEGYIKGNLGPETIITIPGGRVGDIIYEVSEMPVFTVDEEVVTFVYEHPSGKNLVTGGFQGKIRIEKDPVSGERVINTKPATGKLGADDLKGAAKSKLDTDKTKLSDFIREIEGYLK